ncbi:MAG: Do family serine endopeptidase [Opitutaceae bacterium]|nr:Do family serine endopeptidase [Opitutaceae bacterium]
MKLLTRPTLIALTLVLLGLTVWSGAKAAAPAQKSDAPKGKMPALKVDSTPVGEAGRSATASYADMLDKVRPAVVSVYSKTFVQQQAVSQLGPFLVPFGPPVSKEQQGLGSGVIVSSNGYILTNNHVVADADEIEVALNDDRKLSAKVVGRDPKTDIAVLKVEAENLPAATLGDSDRIRVGDIVFAIGNPLAVGQTVTMGIVSATNRQMGILADVVGYEDFIQTDAAINQGNSGGALIDARGRVVGINSAILSNNSQGNIGIGFAVPINLASMIMRNLVEKGSVARGYLGVQTNPITPDLAEAFGLKPDTKGMVITDLNPPDGPAAKAGLKREDVIIGINDKSITSTEELRLTIAGKSPGSKVTIKILRDGKPLSFEATLGQLPDDTGAVGDLLDGISVSPITNELRREMRLNDRINGLVVTNVSDKSPYRDIIPQGAVIVQINGVAVTDMASAQNALREGRNVALIYYRGAMRYIRIDV